jgi:hypothetical protein
MESTTMSTNAPQTLVAKLLLEQEVPEKPMCAGVLMASFGEIASVLELALELS